MCRLRCACQLQRACQADLRRAADFCPFPHSFTGQQGQVAPRHLPRVAYGPSPRPPACVPAPIHLSWHIPSFLQANKAKWPHVIFRESPMTHDKDEKAGVCLPAAPGEQAGGMGACLDPQVGLYGGRLLQSVDPVVGLRNIRPFTIRITIRKPPFQTYTMQAGPLTARAASCWSPTL